MTAERYAVTDEHRLGWIGRMHDLEERFLRGIVNPDDTLAGIQALSEGKLTVPTDRLESVDPLAAFRRIRGLIVLGPDQWYKATTGGKKNRNPLNLPSGWCPGDVPMVIDTPNGQIDITPSLMKELVKLCHTSEWNTTPILWLALDKIPTKPAPLLTSLETMYWFWGVEHDNMNAGIIRGDVHWSNWALAQKHPFAYEAAVTKPRWVIGYGEPPAWSKRLKWADQQSKASERGLTISMVTSDALMLDLTAVCTGKRFRTATWARTSTFRDRYPLNVCFIDNGLRIFDNWGPGAVDDNLAVAVEGVPLELVA